MKTKTMSDFEADLLEKLRNPKFASSHIMSAIVDNDINFLPVAFGDIAKAHGIPKLSKETGISRRTLYKVFDKNGHPSFNLVTQIMQSLGMEIEVRPKKSQKIESFLIESAICLNISYYIRG